MNIIFKGAREKKFYESQKELVREYGPQLGRNIIRRINELQMYDSVGELLDYGKGNPHFLTGNLDKCIGISISGNYRLIVKPLFDEGIDFSKLDLYSIEIIKIMEVDDYHG